MQMKRFVISYIGYSTSFWTNIILSVEITEMNCRFLLSVACTLKQICRLLKDTFWEPVFQGYCQKHCWFLVFQNQTLS